MNFCELTYQLYIIDWKRQHITPEIESDTWKNYFEDMKYFTDDYSFEDYLHEYGYHGEIYASYEEFSDNEYLDVEYICKLVNNEELINKYYEHINAYNYQFSSKLLSEVLDNGENIKMEKISGCAKEKGFTTLNDCEENCLKYHDCPSVTLALDILTYYEKEKFSDE